MYSNRNFLEIFEFQLVQRLNTSPSDWLIRKYLPADFVQMNILIPSYLSSVNRSIPISINENGIFSAMLSYIIIVTAITRTFNECIAYHLSFENALAEQFNHVHPRSNQTIDIDEFYSWPTSKFPNGLSYVRRQSVTV